MEGVTAASGTTSRCAGLSVSRETQLLRSRVKYLSCRARTQYGLSYSGWRVFLTASLRMKTWVQVECFRILHVLGSKFNICGTKTGSKSVTCSKEDRIVSYLMDPRSTKGDSHFKLREKSRQFTLIDLRNILCMPMMVKVCSSFEAHFV